MRVGPTLTPLTLAVAVVVGLPGVPRIAVGAEPDAGEPAEAEAASEYDRLIDEALVEFDAGDYAEALSAFEQAYKVKPSARAQRGVAKALFELRSYARCIEAIDRALESQVEPLTGALRDDLESLKERSLRFVGRATIEVAPETATIVFDGEVIDGTSRATRMVDVGPHTLEVSAPNYQPQRRRFEIHGGEETKVTVRLDPVRTVAARAIPGPAPAPVEGRTIPLVLGIAAAVASTGAVFGSSLWLVDRGGAVDRCNEAAASGARCANADTIAFQRNAAGWALGISGAALAASTIALVVLLRGEKKAPKTTAWTF